MQRKHPLVDVGPDGRATTLCEDFQQAMGQDVFARYFRAWVDKHGIAQVSP
jgi:hypothetical protein